jgi:hypothetical protein
MQPPNKNDDMSNLKYCIGLIIAGVLFVYGYLLIYNTNPDASILLLFGIPLLFIGIIGIIKELV